ncbi:MAG: NADH-quinone oxidoreductase subunit NuoG [Acidiferrobacter sp.]
MLHIEIDGKKLAVEEGAMVIEAADAAGIYIPRFCYHKKLSVAANCRMCLVEVERVAKPVPACATPVTEGMRVFTRSEKTTSAQKGVMEFLLINHPLDCPICDQGGECELQDLAVGYGRDVSRYQEGKRVVADQDLGPFIATEMTRCIHCTRCVRFGQEIGGIMEMGATGRGEHMRIGTYVEASIDSELSGNMIDLCPVGALTSKPFRYSARSWELSDKPSISPHDCVGTNLTIETRRNQVMRVLPRENEAINEVWLSDRDRFSYTAFNGPDRLLSPLLRVGDSWQEVDWEVALEKACEGLRGVVTRHGGQALGALASPQITVEEGFLLQKLMRGLGSENIDHRLRESDFRDDAGAPPFPWLGQDIEDLEHGDAFVLIGSNIRKDQPLLGYRLRKAFLDGAKIAVVNPLDFAFTFDVEDKLIVAPSHMPEVLGRLVVAAAECAHAILPKDVAQYTKGLRPGPVEAKIATWLCAAQRPSILLGPLAASHPQAAVMRALAQCLSHIARAKIGYLPLGNAAGAWLSGVVPHRGPMGVARATPGRSAHAILDGRLKGLLLVDAEPVLDGADGGRALASLRAAECVVVLSAFRSEALDYAHVVLPMAPFTETDGTFVNAEGRWQSFDAAVTPRAQARPGWKILRVLAERLRVAGCDLDSTAEIRAAMGAQVPAHALYAPLSLPSAPDPTLAFERVAQVSMYDSDSIIRHAEEVHYAKDHGVAALYLNKAEAERHGLAAGADAHVVMGAVQLTLEVRIDGQVPDGAAYIPAALAQTAPLPLSGVLSVSRA